MGEVLELVFGAQVWLDGAAYLVDEIAEASVRLSRTDELRRVGLGAITAPARPCRKHSRSRSRAPCVEVLSSSAPKQRAALEWEVAVITDVAQAVHRGIGPDAAAVPAALG